MTSNSRTSLLSENLSGAVELIPENLYNKNWRHIVERTLLHHPTNPGLIPSSRTRWLDFFGKRSHDAKSTPNSSLFRARALQPDLYSRLYVYSLPLFTQMHEQTCVVTPIAVLLKSRGDVTNRSNTSHDDKHLSVLKATPRSQVPSF